MYSWGKLSSEGSLFLKTFESVSASCRDLALTVPAINIRGERYLQAVAKDSGIDIGPPFTVQTAALGPTEHFIQPSFPPFQKNPLPLPLSGACCKIKAPPSPIDESDLSNGWSSSWTDRSSCSARLVLGASGMDEVGKIAMVAPLDSSGRNEPSRGEGKPAVGRHIWTRAVCSGESEFPCRRVFQIPGMKLGMVLPMSWIGNYQQRLDLSCLGARVRLLACGEGEKSFKDGREANM
ncbi:hypothetical protein QBC39DRAFT_134700 [Podospora conica]|nr:hypothetical protein QBC39DRAFT_134700 [Schizothecium conicum]